MWFPSGSSSSSSAREEKLAGDFDQVVSLAIKENGVAFACMQARLLPFSEARFQFQELSGGRPGRLFGTPALAPLEEPWTNGTTGDLLARMEQDSTVGGNFYAYIQSNGKLRRLRSSCVTVLSGVRNERDRSAWSLDAELIGYIYTVPGEDAQLLTPDRVVHYAPIPDPSAQWRGMSWITPVLREISADSKAVRHKERFFRNGATPPFAIRYDPSISRTEFEKYVELFNLQHLGADNAYKILHLGGGAEPKSVGLDMKALDFKSISAAAETRIAAASGAGAIIARLSEGMQGSSLNQGNYHAAKRQFADMTLRPLWRSAAGSLSKVARPPAASRLWVDVRDVAFLAEDEKDVAEILAKNAQTVHSLVDAGFDPDAAIEAVMSDDLSRLTGKHSGLYSVQLQAPGAGDGGRTEMSLPEQLQKIYLAVDKVINADEARRIVGIEGPFPGPSTPEGGTDAQDDV